jgi:serine/threonine protein kinase
MSDRKSPSRTINPSCAFVPSDFITKSKEIQHLGSGTFGKVALYNTPKGQHVVKETKVEDKTLGYPSDFLTEVDMLIKLRPIKTVVTIQGVCFDNEKNKGYILLEPLDCNLSKWSKTTSFEERISQLPNIISMVGGAIATMNHFSFVHNDVKPNNILVKKIHESNEYIFKLADFGNSAYIVDPNVTYCGIPQYSPPLPMDIYKAEFWAFMITLVEVITGGNRLISKKDGVDEFYEPYLSRTSSNRLKFNLSKYLKLVLPKEEYRAIPSIFWKFINPLINGYYTTITECLSNIGITLNTDVINEVYNTISKSVDIQPQYKLIEREFKNRLYSNQLSRKYERFSKLYNKFLSLIPETQRFTDIDLKYYAEVAFVIVARNKSIRLEYFKDQDTFLYFQRAFLMKIGYQIVII